MRRWRHDVVHWIGPAGSERAGDLCHALGHHEVAGAAHDGHLAHGESVGPLQPNPRRDQPVVLAEPQPAPCPGAVQARTPTAAASGARHPPPHRCRVARSLPNRPANSRRANSRRSGSLMLLLRVRCARRGSRRASATGAANMPQRPWCPSSKGVIPAGHAELLGRARLVERQDRDNQRRAADAGAELVGACGGVASPLENPTTPRRSSPGRRRVAPHRPASPAAADAAGAWTGPRRAGRARSAAHRPSAARRRLSRDCAGSRACRGRTAPAAGRGRRIPRPPASGLR
jgi:hypothetical protein